VFLAFSLTVFGFILSFTTQGCLPSRLSIVGLYCYLFSCIFDVILTVFHCCVFSFF
jgi:hypothetical protein